MDKAGRPVVAYALWFPTRRTFLRVARVTVNGKLTVKGLTRDGFPPSAAPPAAAPVVLGSGELRVVETYVPAGIEWRFEKGDWWGKLLHSSARGFPVGPIAAAASGSTVYAAWTEAFPAVAPPAIVLATRADRVRSGVALEDAVLGGLAVTSTGPELAANRCVPAAAFGLEGNGVCGGLITGAGVDGIVADYAAAASARRLLLQTADSLQWVLVPHAALATCHVRARLHRPRRGRVRRGDRDLSGEARRTNAVFNRPAERRRNVHGARARRGGRGRLPRRLHRSRYRHPARGPRRPVTAASP